MGDENGCDVCGYGSNIKQTFEVSMVQGTGYTISGEPTAFEGEDYTFTVTIADGYRRRDTFAVKVNGEAVTESTETIGSFTYENVQGPLSITVEGVEKIPDFFTVSLPDGTGKGYRVASVNGSSTVPYGGDYQFTVTMHENFRKGNRFQVLVNDNEAITPDENGVYTLTNVLENKTITVEGVAAKPYSDTAKIMMTITKGENTLYETPETGSDQMLLLTEMEIPYFDIEINLGIFYYFLAVLFIAGMVNSVNLTDGIDGLCSSVSAVVGAFFAVVAFIMLRPELAIFPATVIGGTVGFLMYNFYPAKIFMGDTGSLYLGGAVVGMAFLINEPLIILLAGIIYLVEVASVILQVGYFKLTHGKRIFKMAPIHHHFEKCGWSEVKIVGVFTLITAVACVIAYFGL
jgi:hypothetical protein